MEKVGILTYHNITNFGAYLQAKSLFLFLAEKGYDVEFLDYTPTRVVVREWAGIIRPFLKLNFSKGMQLFQRWNTFQNEAKKLKRSKSCAFTFKGCSRLASAYATLICGSDEIWNTSAYLGYMPAYFLAFPTIHGQRRLSYAASMGQGYPTPEEEACATTALSQFQSIFVRDDHTLQWVKKLLRDASSRPVLKVVDPTLLCNVAGIPPKEKNIFF